MQRKQGDVKTFLVVYVDDDAFPMSAFVYVNKNKLKSKVN